MQETRSSGSVEGVMSNRDPYSDSCLSELSANPKNGMRILKHVLAFQAALDRCLRPARAGYSLSAFCRPMEETSVSLKPFQRCIS